MQRPGMAAVFVLGSSLLLSHIQLGVGGPVFLSGEAADLVLRRHKRANNGMFEEFKEGNVERECMEELCDLEEAREIFEDDEMTMRFWARYIDENQCESSPCLNEGTCQDHLGYHTCICPQGFTGTNCEIAIEKRCDLNNGDCMHFCELMNTFGARCSCAAGYKLMENGHDCEPEVEFPCGQTALMMSAIRRSLVINTPIVVQSNTGNASHANASAHANTSHPSATTSVLAPPNITVVHLQAKRSVEGPPGTISPPWTYSSSEPPTELPKALPTEEPKTPLRRIVGGVEAIQGEIPWQAALVSKSSGRIFCGGSIVDKQWVVTAAHCLTEAGGPFIVRVGELRIYDHDGYEKEHEVQKEHIHPRYNFTRSKFNHDIALLYLKEPITFSSMVRPICLGPKPFIEDLLKDSLPATVSGWGRMRFQGATPNMLLKVEVPFTDQSLCKDSSSQRITRFMFCAGYDKEQMDACQGDSGGPHAKKIYDTWFLTGIVSWGEECARSGKYGVYTRVSQYYPWIKHVMEGPRDNMEEPV